MKIELENFQLYTIYTTASFLYMSIYMFVYMYMYIVHEIKELLNLAPLVLKARHLVALPFAEIRFA